MYCVYKHTCPNGKVYIGMTGISPARRWQQGKNYITNTYFYRAIQKYGWDNIKHEILIEGLSKEEASAKEIELIALYKSDQRNCGYNICSGGEINIPSAATRLKMGNSRRGKKHSPEAKLKMSAVAIGKPGTMTGKHHSEEAKKRISASQQKTKIYQYTRYGKFIADYESICDAARQTNLLRETIAAVASPNNSRKSAKGFIFTKETFTMVKYHEALINVRKELEKQNAEIKPILEDFDVALSEMHKLISAEQNKTAELLAPVREELNKIKSLISKNVKCQSPAILDNSKINILPVIPSALAPADTDAVLEKLADKIISKLNSITTIIINIQTEATD